MNKIFTLLIAVILCSSAQDKKADNEERKVSGPLLLLKEKEKKVEKKWEMKQYFLVLLKRGPVRDQDSIEVEKLQKAHIANIERLYNEGKMDIAGPIGAEGDLRGIFIINASSFEEAKSLCDTDPMIKIGRLVAEIYPWWAGKGSILR